jgi:hypothetical protein
MKGPDDMGTDDIMKGILYAELLNQVPPILKQKIMLRLLEHLEIKLTPEEVKAVQYHLGLNPAYEGNKLASDEIVTTSENNTG